MIRFSAYALTGIFTAMSIGPVSAQKAGTGTTPTAPAQGQTQPSQTPAAPSQGQTQPNQTPTPPVQGQAQPNQSPTTSMQGQTQQGQAKQGQVSPVPIQGQTQPGQTQQGQFPSQNNQKGAQGGISAVGQPGQNMIGQQGQNMIGQQGQNPVAQKGSIYGGVNQVSQTPWYSNPNIQQQMGLNTQQYNQLNRQYGQAYNQYQMAVNNLPQNLSPQQRAQQIEALQQTFQNSLSAGVNNTLINPVLQQRYNQTYLQYQGFAAFNNPAIQQKLNLTPAQIQQINQYQQQANQQTGQTGTTNPYLGFFNQQSASQINSILTPQQQQMWSQLTGQPYNFEPSAYYQNNTGSGTSTNTNGSTGTNNPQ